MTQLNKNIIEQLLKSSTSVGANYREANGASSYRDFRNKIYICKKEIQETNYWLMLLTDLLDNPIEELSTITNEAIELSKIFGSIAKKVSN